MLGTIVYWYVKQKSTNDVKKGFCFARDPFFVDFSKILVLKSVKIYLIKA